MGTKIFGDKKITVRKLAKSDLKIADKFKVFINSLIQENAKLLMNKKIDTKGERLFLESQLKAIKNKNKVYLVAECDNKIVGTTGIELQSWRRNHIGRLGIAIVDGYRGVGLGKYLMSEIIKLAKKELSPKPKIIQLEVYINNKPAINLYKKLGFKVVGKIPGQVQWKTKLIGEFIMMLEA